MSDDPLKRRRHNWSKRLHKYAERLDGPLPMACDRPHPRSSQWRDRLHFHHERLEGRSAIPPRRPIPRLYRLEGPHPRSAEWTERLQVYEKRLDEPMPLLVEGKLKRIVGLTLEATGVQAPIGARCLVANSDGKNVEAEVVGFSEDKLFLMPTGDMRGITPNARVVPTGQTYEAPVGEGLLGRVIDGRGRPLDGLGPLDADEYVPMQGRPINPLSRNQISEPLDVGVRAINSMLTVGKGQRIGLFAGSGVGKSVLLGMMTRFTEAEVIVVGLIGERGREVKEFIYNTLGEEGMSRSVVVAAPADAPPVLRLHGASLATRIAEYFRDQGKNVLLLMDSLTRYAQAQREIALAIGEPPATRGYPPSVFARIPQLVERAGNGDVGGGSITAFYTVLAEGDDQQDPIADAARAILDGHIVLSRSIAEMGRYPAIDIEQSISRVMTEIVDPTHLRAARLFKQHYSNYERNRDLISVGAYSAGSDPAVDAAIKMQPLINAFLSQDMGEPVDFPSSRGLLLQAMQVQEAKQQQRQAAPGPVPAAARV
ncbi:MAG: flagellar protein export ATPase FliI [Gammaproteobacteria bacterium]|nr:flagellar protein export ATPase FliI [Gammaproteobacteria bacterium]